MLYSARIAHPLVRSLSGVLLCLGVATACTTAPVPAGSAGLEWLSFRVRQDASAPLNADAGWAAPENAAAQLYYDQPFRLRVQVRASDVSPEGHQLGLQYQRQQGPWLPVGMAEFPYPQFATPMVSVISTTAYHHGDDTERLLGSADLPWDDGAGLSAVATTPVWRTTGDALEWEWPLVIRRFADGAGFAGSPGFAEDGEQFGLRVVDAYGQALPGSAPVLLTLTAADGHLGGTFIETPARLGPYQNTQGHLIFFMEPAETHNRFMAVLSTDYGRSWAETDGAGRPMTGDLEGVASVQVGSTVHVIHQISEAVYHHAFEMGQEPGESGRWLITDELITTMAEPPTQIVDVVARRDGSLVTVYGGATRLFMQVRSADGQWQAPREIDSDTGPVLSGPVMAIAGDDRITLAYTGRDGLGFIRHLLPDGSLTQRQVLANTLGTTDADNGGIAPMVMLENGSTVVIYREQSGLLFERRFSRDGELSAPVQVTDRAVVTNAVDSEQVGADLVWHAGALHLLYIDDQTRDVFYMQSSVPGVWSQPRPVLENVDAGWVRGSVHRDATGRWVYGVVVDTGSQGGSGFNRYIVVD